MSLEECVICLQGTSENEMIIKITCCKKPIHQTCLDSWLNEYNSRGRCPHCRHRLRPVRGIPNIMIDRDLNVYDDTEIAYRWNHPRGTINITSGNGNCDVSIQSHDIFVQPPIIHKCSYSDMEDNIPNEFIAEGHVIVLTNEDGDYFDTVNIPSGWMLCVNGNNHTLQLTTYLRIE